MDINHKSTHSNFAPDEPTLGIGKVRGKTSTNCRVRSIASKTDIHRHAEKRNTEKKEIKKERWKDIIGPHRLTDTHS